MRKYAGAFTLPTIDTDRRRVVQRLEREGWIVRQVGGHDVYSHPGKSGRIPLPRQRVLSIGVARSIARAAGWI